MVGVVDQSQEQMGGAPAVGMPGIARPRRLPPAGEAPMLDIVDRLQVADRHHGLNGVGDQGHRSVETGDDADPGNL